MPTHLTAFAAATSAISAPAMVDPGESILGTPIIIMAIAAMAAAAARRISMGSPDAERRGNGRGREDGMTGSGRATMTRSTRQGAGLAGILLTAVDGNDASG